MVPREAGRNEHRNHTRYPPTLNHGEHRQYPGLNQSVARQEQDEVLCPAVPVSCPEKKSLPGGKLFFLSTRIDVWRKPKPFQVGAKISNKTSESK